MNSHIPSLPEDIPSQPDSYTAKSPDLARGADAPGRVLHINLSWISYGSNDKAHAAALVLSFSLLLMLLILSLITSIAGALSVQLSWADNVFQWLGSAFLFTAGIAVGRGAGGNGKSD